MAIYQFKGFISLLFYELNIYTMIWYLVRFSAV